MNARMAPKDTWPELRVTLLPLPWTWHINPRIYWDDVDGPLGLSTCWFLFLRLEFWGNPWNCMKHKRTRGLRWQFMEAKCPTCRDEVAS